MLYMYVSETIRLGVVLSAERIGANKIVALCEAMHIHIRSNACCEILIVTFYICAGSCLRTLLGSEDLASKHLLRTTEVCDGYFSMVPV